MHRILVLNQLVPTRILNQFLQCIRKLRLCDDDGARLQLMDKYYLRAKSIGVKPDAVTFNTLLKANRKCKSGIRGKLANIHLREMAELGIAVDSFTIVELLAMCAKCPQGNSMNNTMKNKQVADTWFEYYLTNIFPHIPSVPGPNGYSGGKLPPLFVFNTYLDVYAEDCDVKGMTCLLIMARGKALRIDENDRRIGNTFYKGRRKMRDFYNSYYALIENG